MAVHLGEPTDLQPHLRGFANCEEGSKRTHGQLTEFADLLKRELRAVGVP
jgi:hypothetical protein